MANFANYTPVWNSGGGWMDSPVTSSMQGYGASGVVGGTMSIPSSQLTGLGNNPSSTPSGSSAPATTSSSSYQIPGVTQTDPSKFYQDKLQAMSSGTFSPDDPSYQFRLSQGQQTLERSQAAGGFTGSGRAAVELQQYGQNTASTEYAAQFSRMLEGMSGVESTFNSQQSRLMQMAGIGINQQNADTNTFSAQATDRYQQGELAIKAGANLNGNSGGGSSAAAGTSSQPDWTSYFNAQAAVSASQSAAGVDALGNQLTTTLSGYGASSYA